MEGDQSLRAEFKRGTTENLLPMWGGGEGRGVITIQQNLMLELGYIYARAEYELRTIICWSRCRVLVSKKEEKC